MTFAGVDIVAASGYHGTLPRDMVIQAHAGERVDITPTGTTAGYNTRTGNTEVHVHIGRIETPNTKSMKRWVKEDLAPLLIGEFRRQGARRVPIVSSRSIIAEG